MLGSKAPVIPPATDPPEEATAPATAPTAIPGALAPVPASGLSTIVQQLRQAARPRSVKLDALLNGSCEAVSWQDGVLTLGFFEDKFHKKGVEETATRKIYEELAAQILGAPVAIRCIIAQRPAKALSKSPLVQHAVQTHGATIVSEDEEP